MHGKPFWPPRAAYLSDIAKLFIAHDSNTLGTFTNEYVTLSKSEYDSLIQKMQSVSTSDITTLVHSSISYLASSSPSSWIIDSDLSTHVTGKSTIFHFSHIYVPFIVFY